MKDKNIKIGDILIVNFSSGRITINGEELDCEIGDPLLVKNLAFSDSENLNKNTLDFTIENIFKNLRNNKDIFIQGIPCIKSIIKRSRITKVLYE